MGWIWLLTLVIGYLLGCLNSGVVLGRLVSGVDVREHGSGNAGATNALRVLGWKVGLATLVADAGKAALSAAVGLWLGGEIGGCIGAVAAVIGHNWPVMFHFKGGKGVAASLGCLLVLMPLETLVALLVFIVVVHITRYVSLGSLCAGFMIPVLALITHGFDNNPLLYMGLAIFAIVAFQHRGNIQRLRKGDEHQISFTKKQG